MADEEIELITKMNGKSREKKLNKFRIFTTGILAVLLVVTIFQSYQISVLSSEIKITGAAGISSSTTSNAATLQQVLEEITPKGTPNYGAKAGVSYDKVEDSLRTLVGYQQSISLSGNDKKRYIEIATARGTACEFCCGIGDAGFGKSSGEIACGCSHNVAFGGLTKWLIKNTDYTNKQIIDEIQKWKILFFPQDAVKRELQARNIQPESVGLPAMVGGC